MIALLQVVTQSGADENVPACEMR